MGPTVNHNLRKLKAGKTTVHSISSQPSTGSGRPGTLGNQDVDSQVDPLFSVPGQPLGLVGRPRILGFTDKHLAGNGLVTEFSYMSGRPPGLGGRPHTQDIPEEEMFQLPVSSIKPFVPG